MHDPRNPWTMPVRTLAPVLRGLQRGRAAATPRPDRVLATPKPRPGRALAGRPALGLRGGGACRTLLECSQAGWRGSRAPFALTGIASVAGLAPRSITIQREAQFKRNLHIFCAAHLSSEGNRMKQPNDVFNDLQSKVSDLLKNSPARDVERNVRAMLSQGFSKLELVTREEFDAQTQVLVRTRARLEELERRVAELEQKLPVTGQSS
jgi:ubiquinone biosynthesis accessory factor UbiK